MDSPDATPRLLPFRILPSSNRLGSLPENTVHRGHVMRLTKASSTIFLQGVHREMKVTAAKVALVAAAATLMAWIVPGQLRAQGPMGPPRSMNINVNCGAGQTIAGALARANAIPGNVAITIHGVCEETVNIARDNITLQGATRDDGIRAPSGEPWAVSIKGQHGVRLANLTITQGGITIWGGSSVEAEQITVENSSNNIGIIANSGASALLTNVIVRNISGVGVSVGTGGHITLSASEVRNNRIGVFVTDGGSVNVGGTTIENNSGFGAGAVGDGVLAIGGGVVQNNPLGLLVKANSTLVLGPNAVVRNNGTGAELEVGGFLHLRGSTLQDNTGIGIIAHTNSIVYLDGGAVVQNNGASGVELHDASVVTGIGSILNNAGWGIYCGDPSSRIGTWGTLQIGTNGQGGTNCQ